MKQREFQLSGNIDTSGNLQMYMGELNEFLKKWKGNKVIVCFTVSKPGASEPLKAYYLKVVVAAFRRAFAENGEWLTQEQTEKRLRAICPITIEETVDTETGEFTQRVRELTELDNQELVHYIEYLKQLGAEEFGIYIEDPNTY